jgi:hypothetical protein
VPSGKSPFSPVSVFFPKNQPSPKSSSRSISSMRSPRLRLSSSGLRARNSSAVPCQLGLYTFTYRVLTDDDERIAGFARLCVGSLHRCGSGRWARGSLFSSGEGRSERGSNSCGHPSIKHSWFISSCPVADSRYRRGGRKATQA